MIPKVFEQVQGLGQQLVRFPGLPGPLLGDTQPVQCPRLAVPVTDVTPDGQRLTQRGYGLVHPSLAEVGDAEVAERLSLGVQVKVAQQGLQGLSAHAALEVVPKTVAQLAVEQLIADELLDVELAERVENLVETVTW